MFPLSPPKYKHALNNCCNHCFFLPWFLITKQLTSIHNTHNLCAFSYTPPISRLEKGHGCLLESTTSNESEDELLKCVFTASQFVATGNQEKHTDKMSTWFQWKRLSNKPPNSNIYFNEYLMTYFQSYNVWDEKRTMEYILFMAAGNYESNDLLFYHFSSCSLSH